VDKKLNNKLQKIDMLLSNEFELKKYIDNIENTQISFSNNLQEKILSKTKKNKPINYSNIYKIVACTILALILCQTDYIKNTNYIKKEQVSQELVQRNTFINDKINELNNFFMKPINLEKEEK
jgi:hypothetical protein